ncbi:MAG: hypothetical protein ABL914_03700 [Novosphingobium sp.]|uniref:hypothetical protein n=1 Tax=Novosphingobium sp. TaxID=1874826 RepID=UPI0032BDA7E9
MKASFLRKAIAPLFALSAITVPTASQAESGLNYNDLVHCAAFNQVVAGVLGLDGGEVKNKDQIDQFNGYSVSLMVIAAVSADKDAKQVGAEVSTESDKIIEILGDSAKSDGYIEENMSTCVNMGKAAVEVVEEATKDK